MPDAEPLLVLVPLDEVPIRIQRHDRPAPFGHGRGKVDVFVIGNRVVKQAMIRSPRTPSRTDAFPAVGENYLYCAQDGFGWGGTKGVDFSSEDWKATWTLTVARYDLKTGKVVEFPGKKRAFEADTMEVGPGSNHPDLRSFNLGGLAVLDGKIYLGSRDKNAVIIFDAETGKKTGSHAVKGVRHLAAGKSNLYAATDSGIVRVDGGKTIISSGDLDITGLTIGPKGDFWLTDAKTHQVHRVTASGERIQTVGNPGGPYKGSYDRNRMVEPAGLAFGPDGKLWVTEKRWNPKRILAWDAELNSVVYEKFGMPHYGGDGSGFDSENPRRWIGLGCFWDVDVETGEAEPTHIFSDDEATSEISPAQLFLLP